MSPLGTGQVQADLGLAVDGVAQAGDVGGDRQRVVG